MIDNHVSLEMLKTLGQLELDFLQFGNSNNDFYLLETLQTIETMKVKNVDIHNSDRPHINNVSDGNFHIGLVPVANWKWITTDKSGRIEVQYYN